VVTDKGTVHAEHVVNAGGLWAREVGRMAGLKLPILAMEHQYLITDDIPEFEGQKGTTALHRLRGRNLTCARNVAACCSGTYERAGVPWSPRTTPWDFGQDLLPRTISIASRRSLEVGASGTSRGSRRPASRRLSTVPSPSRRTATR
jgi:dimethylglycine dehydrogenase